MHRSKVFPHSLSPVQTFFLANLVSLLLIAASLPAQNTLAVYHPAGFQLHFSAGLNLSSQRKAVQDFGYGQSTGYQRSAVSAEPLNLQWFFAQRWGAELKLGLLPDGEWREKTEILIANTHPNASDVSIETGGLHTSAQLLAGPVFVYVPRRWFLTQSVLAGLTVIRFHRVAFTDSSSFSYPLQYGWGLENGRQFTLSSRLRAGYFISKYFGVCLSTEYALVFGKQLGQSLISPISKRVLDTWLLQGGVFFQFGHPGP